jgi:hypothetical protein
MLPVRWNGEEAVEVDSVLDIVTADVEDIRLDRSGSGEAGE